MKQKRRYLLLVLVVFFLLWGYFISRMENNQADELKMASSMPSKPVSPSDFTGLKDDENYQRITTKVDKDYQRITTKRPLNITLDIPKTAAFKMESDGGSDWGIEIKYENLDITYCTGCDWVGSECGGFSLENCISRDSAVGNSELTEYFLKSSPNYLVRATSNLKVGDIRSIELLIKTNNHKALTADEIVLIEKINLSISNN